MMSQKSYAYSNDAIDKILFCLLIICFGFRDILPNMGVSVLPFLALIFLIPCIIIVRELLHRRMSRNLTWLVGTVVCFYVVIIPFNPNAIKLFLPLFLAAVSFKDLDVRCIAKFFFVLEVTILLFRWMLIENGVLEVGHMYTDKIDEGISYDLGYGNPNTPGVTIFVALCCLHILMYERWRWLSFVLILSTSLLAFQYTASRTMFFSCTLLLLTYLVPESLLRRFIYNKVFLFLIPIVLISFIFLSEYLMDNSVLNTLMTGRVGHLQVIMSMFSSPLTFITGLQSDMVGSVDFPVDNGMAYLLCVGGLVAVGLFFFRYVQLIEEKNQMSTAVFTVIIVMLISGIGEKTIANFGVAGGSLFWLFLFNTSYRNTNTENDVEESMVD
ncbi:hypothetical protein QVN89_07665 [Bacteroides gallinaceum]|nr:hypothetical protein [Bacteroides gallinaceum]